jgi:hypothetical protein
LRDSWLRLQVGQNSLRVRVAEGLPTGLPKSIKVGETEISDCTAIEITHESRVFEIFWRSYVGYSMLNESYASVNDDECYEGNRFRTYSKSHFILFMSKATFACDEYPGPTQHYCIACEDHVLHVLSVETPTVRRINGPERSRGASESVNLIH